MAQRIEAHLPALRRYAAHLARGQADMAEDLVQETCARLLAKKGTLADVQNLEGYLLTVMRNLFVDTLRQQAREMPLEACEPVARTDDAALRRDLTRALARLPKPQARALVAHLVEGLSYAQIAAREDVAPGTVMSRIARARAALRKSCQGAL